MTAPDPSYRDLTLRSWLDAVAAPEPAPGGGGAAAATAALAAALVAMAARFARTGTESAEKTAARADALRERSLQLADEDAAAYTAVLEAYRLPKDAPRRRERIVTTLERATTVPLEIAEIGAEVAELGADIGTRGNPNLAGDAATAVHLAVAATRSAAELALINARLGDLGPDTVERARFLMDAAETSATLLPVPR